MNVGARNVLYLDHNATTPMRAEAVEAMLPWLGRPANPADVRTKRAVDTAREQMADLIGARPSEVVFTSGATEANNIALRCTSAQTLVVSAIEHPSVLRTAEALSGVGRKVVVVGPDSCGQVAADRMLAAAASEATLLSLMLANNETGVLNDIPVLAGARGGSTLLHSDATQAAGRVALNVDLLGVDLMSLSAHKFGGPQGVGVLYARRGTELIPHAQTGGGQERGRRSGTLNVAGIAAAGAAAEAALRALDAAAAQSREQRDRFENLVLAAGLDAVVLGGEVPRLTNTSLIAIPGAVADAVIAGAPNIAISHGSACAAGAPGPSHVLRAMRIPDEIAECALRVTFGPTNVLEDADTAASSIAAAATRVLSHTRTNLGGVA